jgi:hypothetical protein
MKNFFNRVCFVLLALVFSGIVNAGYAQASSDKPIPQFEFSLQTFLIKPDSLKMFYGQPVPGNNAHSSILVLTHSFQPVLDQLITQKKATLTNAPRFTTHNNVEASFGPSTTAPIQLKAEYPDGKDQSLPWRFGMEKQFLTTITPALNDDDSFTVSVNVSVNTLLRRWGVFPMRIQTDSEKKPDEKILLSTEVIAFTKVVLHDKDTILVTGIDPALLGMHAKNDATLALFLNVHRIK